MFIKLRVSAHHDGSLPALWLSRFTIRQFAFTAKRLHMLREIIIFSPKADFWRFFIAWSRALPFTLFPAQSDDAW
ncbi:hypothetical protein LAD67_16960 [Escherichia coli]|nr:hypothetical protein [Escherichia coli]